MKKLFFSRIVILFCVVLCLLSIAALFYVLLHSQPAIQVPVTGIRDNGFQNLISEDSLLWEEDPETKKATVYTLEDPQLVAPVPNPASFGEVNSSAEMAAVQRRAKLYFDTGSNLFHSGTKTKDGSTIHYYLDETIYAVTWKQVVNDSTYTFSEIQISHPSQIRRFFSDGQFGSAVLQTTSEMASTVNAVVASSGDYYGYRSIGIVVNEGIVLRDRGELLDTCYIDEKGELIFTYAGQITGKEEIQAFVDRHHLRFSLCFGPVLLLNGELCVPTLYNSGEIHNPYARSAICQMGPLHYVLVTANMEPPNHKVPTVMEFAVALQQMGIPKAYALDGGQTAAIVMGGKLINTVSYGSQREISDIVYFATALPN